MSKKLCNHDIRTRTKECGIRLWEVAEKMKISEPTMTRMLRKELPAERKAEIFKIIDTLAEQEETA